VVGTGIYVSDMFVLSGNNDIWRKQNSWQSRKRTDRSYSSQHLATRTKCRYQRILKVGNPISMYRPEETDSPIAHNSIWSDFIPAEEYHVFQRGAYYSSEVIPDKLAVISLNTIYWYDANKGAHSIPTNVWASIDVRLTRNTAVDGCKDGSDEPGALEFDWLEVQLDSFRERGMQACTRNMLRVVMSKPRALSGLAHWSRTASSGLVLRQLRQSCFVITSGGPSDMK
jgi:hypothetical protein